MTANALPLSKPKKTHEYEEEDPRQQLMFDPLPREQMNSMVMEAMHVTTR